MNNFNFPVVEKKLKTVDGLIAPSKAIVRTDTNRILGVMGNDYKLVLHKDVLHDVEKSIPTELKNRSISLCKDGAVMFAKYETPKIKAIEVNKGDIVKFGIEVFNSYDGSLPVGFMFVALRLVCTNGMTIPKSIARISVRHTGGMDLRGIKEEFTERLPLYMKTSDRWREWSDIKPSENRVSEFLKNNLGKRSIKKFEEKYKNNNDKTVWGLYNVFTQYNTHDIKLRKNNEQNKRLAQFHMEKGILNNFYNFNWAKN